METSFDIIIIGAGIAGTSLASELCAKHNVLLLEREEQPGFHATGRSAAIYFPSYGPPVIQALTRASGSFFHSPPDGFCNVPLLSPRSTLMIAKDGDEGHIKDALLAGMSEIEISQATKCLPPLNCNIYNRAFVDNDTLDIDVDVLLQGFLKKIKRTGGTFVRQAEVNKIEQISTGWRLTCGDTLYSAPTIVNAAGAWADEIAKMANLAIFSLQPRRRSAAIVDVSDKWDTTNWPLAYGAGDTFYFKPMGKKLMISPADETIVEPHDAWADDMAIAEAMELFKEATGHEITHVEHTWAGLRTFAPDGDPVVGFDNQAPGFFWLSGQGGYGIQTSPALSRVAAALIVGEEVPNDIAEFGVDARTLAPNRS